MTAAKIHLPVSVVVPSFERPQGIRKLFASFRNASFACDIVVVDDCSSTNIPSIIEDFPDLDILYLRNWTNFGPARSRNVGIAASRHDFVAFTDDDCQVTPDWLTALHDGLTRSDKNVAGIGGRVVAGGSDIVSRYYEYHKILDPWYFKGRFFYLVTANCLFRRAALDEVGGFDESLKEPGGEDPGLCFKLLKRGYRFVYNPDAIVVHDFAPSILAFIKTFLRYGFGCSIQSQRYFDHHDIQTPITFGALADIDSDEV